MTDDDRKAIAEASPETLAQWWRLLNGWEWPQHGLGEADPVPTEAGALRFHRTRRGEIMSAIVERIGVGACLREWNRETMSDEQFNAWWESRRKGFADRARLDPEVTGPHIGGGGLISGGIEPCGKDRERSP